MHVEHQVLMTLVVALACGVALQVLAARLRIPAIVPLLAGGIALGPDMLGLVRPDSLGAFQEPLISMAVALILFEGGMSLDMRDFRSGPHVVGRLVSIGVGLTWFITAFAAMCLLKVGLSTAALLSSLITVTGPTVVSPLLKRIHVVERVHGILHWEAVLIDPIGVFVALLCYEAFFVSGSVLGIGGSWGSFAVRVVTGITLGVAGGFAMNHCLKRRWIPSSLINITVLGFAMLLLGISDSVLPHTGLLTVAVAGFVLGRLELPSVSEVMSFKQQLTDLAVAVLFIVLAADLDLAAFVHLGWPGVGLIAIVIFFVRPLVVWVSALGEGLPWREKLLIAWIGPRGIVAASMASLFANHLGNAGFEGATVIEPFTYGVIITTVVLQGSTAGFVARILGLRRPEAKTWLLIGARRLGCDMARALREAGADVLLVDRNRGVVREALVQGHDALCRDALDPALAADPRLADVGQVLCVTDNELLNGALAVRWAEELGPDRVMSWRELLSLNPGQGWATGSPEGLDNAGRVSQGLERGTFEVRLVDGVQPRADARPLIWTAEQDAWLAGLRSATGAAKTVMLTWQGAASDLFQAADVFPGEQKNLEALYLHLLRKIELLAPGLPAVHLAGELAHTGRCVATPIGHEVAIAHTYVSEVTAPLCAIAVCPQGVELGDAQSSRVKVLFLLLSPEHVADLHLVALAQIARWAADKARVSALLAESDEQELLAHLRRFAEADHARP